MQLQQEFFQTTSDISPKNLAIGLSSNFNLVIIKGDFIGDIHGPRFLELFDSIRTHMERSNILNIYINLDFIDLAGMPYLSGLVDILNEASRIKDNYICVYCNSNSLKAIDDLSNDVTQILQCEFRLFRN